jgi:Cdc6-like AAA superfamily ATPase
VSAPDPTAGTTPQAVDRVTRAVAQVQKIARASQIFTPGYPVQQKDLFAGRSTQLNRAIESLSAPGRHPVIFGQRGVGKTSLANILSDALQGLVALRISCDGSDTFVTVWNRILYTASVTFKQNAFGFAPEQATRTVTLAEALGHDPQTTKPAEIADLLRRTDSYCVLILDEFDKIQDHRAKTEFADLVKILSDTVPKTTLVLVGVAENIHELVGQHPSIDRNLVQIELPPMSDEEIGEIMAAGFAKLGLTVEDGVIARIPPLAGGFPHYAHLLGLCAAKAAVRNATTLVTHQLFDVACNLALEDAIEKYRDSFARGTATTQASRYPLILAACGYARADTRGVFRATDVVDAVADVFDISLPIQAVVPALGEFLRRERAEILQAVKVANRQCYRFRDPMMRPFCRLKAGELLRLLGPTPRAA